MRAINNTEKDQRKDDYENVVTSGYRVLPQDKHVAGQELIIKIIINDPPVNSYSKNKPDMDVAGLAMPHWHKLLKAEALEGGPANKTIKGQ